MRILATSLPATSHFNRVFEVLEAATADGHQVTYIGSAAFTSRLSAAGINAIQVGADHFAETSIHDEQRWRAETERFLIAQTTTMVDHLSSLVKDLNPDLVVRDFSEKAGGIVAEVENIRQVTVACTAFSSLERFTRPNSWFNVMRQRAGLAPTRTTGRESPGASVAFGPRDFYEGDAVLRRRLIFARHENRHPRQDDVVETVFDWLRPEWPTVIVSLGTIVPLLSESEFAYIASELAHMPVNAVFVRPGPERSIESVGENGLIVRDGPLQQLLARADALVCHAGINSVMEAICYGRPVINLPVVFDQFFLADRCTRLGLGPTITPDDAHSGALCRAVDQVLGDDRHRRAAARMAQANAETALLSESLRSGLLDS